MCCLQGIECVLLSVRMYAVCFQEVGWRVYVLRVLSYTLNPQLQPENLTPNP